MSIISERYVKTFLLIFLIIEEKQILESYFMDLESYCSIFYYYKELHLHFIACSV